jgi:hypothetical protein
MGVFNVEKIPDHRKYLRCSCTFRRFRGRTSGYESPSRWGIHGRRGRTGARLRPATPPASRTRCIAKVGGLHPWQHPDSCRTHGRNPRMRWKVRTFGSKPGRQRTNRIKLVIIRPEDQTISARAICADTGYRKNSGALPGRSPDERRLPKISSNAGKARKQAGYTEQRGQNSPFRPMPAIGSPAEIKATSPADHKVRPSRRRDQH